MTTTINNEHKKLNVPNLRFPEFQGEWEKHELGGICEIITDFVAAGSFASLRENVKYYQEDNYAQLVRTVDLKKDFTNNDFVYVDEFAYDFLWRVQLKEPNIVLPNIGANIGEKYYVSPKDLPKEKNVLGPNAILLRSKCNDTHFVFFRLSTSSYDNEMKKLVGASGQPKFNKTDLKKVRLFIPSLKEQKKISYFLGLLEERIATQNKIIDRLQSLIKGIVDCTILRKGKNAIVGDVCSISEQIRAEANIDDIITVRLHGNGVCKSSAENLQLGATQYYRRRAGQLIYGKQNFHNGAIGIVPISLDNGITSKDIPSFDIDEMMCNSVYLLAQLQSPQYYKPAEALTTGTGSKRLKEETFLKMPIVLPNKREQDNIAVLIHRASMNLDHAKRLLELLSIQKQFLLRQMFI